MKKQTREIIIPEYMNQFQCIGSACEDTCCAGWRVDVDKGTFNKYRSTKHPEMKTLLKENVIRNRSAGSDVAYAKIKMDETGHCALLDVDRLCKIQKELGPEFLSNTCAIYPRNLTEVNGVVEKTAALSCPEAARLVLLNEQGIGFIQNVEPSETKGFIQKNSMSKEQRGLFWDLRIFAIRTLQNRTISIENRLIILGLFLKKFDELDTDNKSGKMLALIQEFDKNIEDKNFIESINRLPANIEFQIKLCKNLFDYRKRTSMNSKRYVECVEDMVNGLGLNGDVPDVEVIQQYKDAYELNYKPYFENHEYILENYLVNYVFMNLFPFNKQSVTDSFAMLIINFSMIKLHLIGMAKYHQGLTDDLVIKLIQSYSKTIDHDTSYLTNIENLMKAQGYTTLAHMVVLVKS